MWRVEGKENPSNACKEVKLYALCLKVIKKVMSRDYADLRLKVLRGEGSVQGASFALHGQMPANLHRTVFIVLLLSCLGLQSFCTQRAQTPLAMT